MDNYAVGCIIAEIYLGRYLFPREVESDLECLAIIEKVLGPFPELFARNFEQNFAGTFILGRLVSVAFPPTISEEARATHGVALHRLETIKPLSVSPLKACLSDTFTDLPDRPLSTIPCYLICYGV